MSRCSLPQADSQDVVQAPLATADKYSIYSIRMHNSSIRLRFQFDSMLNSALEKKIRKKMRKLVRDHHVPLLQKVFQTAGNTPPGGGGGGGMSKVKAREDPI